jgi:hypothetical protein
MAAITCSAAANSHGRGQHAQFGERGACRVLHAQHPVHGAERLRGRAVHLRQDPQGVRILNPGRRAREAVMPGACDAVQVSA